MALIALITLIAPMALAMGRLLLVRHADKQMDERGMARLLLGPSVMNGARRLTKWPCCDANSGRVIGWLNKHHNTNNTNMYTQMTIKPANGRR